MTILTIINQAEGGQSVNKLIIGTTTLNILITSTFTLKPRCEEMSSAGPGAPMVLNGCDLNQAQVLLRKENIQEYINGTTNTKFDIAQCRQLTTRMGDSYTYLPCRSNLFDSLTLQPIKVFALHKLPFVGFLLAKTNAARKILLFFSIVAKCVMEKNGILKIKELEQIHKLNIENHALDSIIASLDNKEDINVLELLAKEKGLSKLTQSLSIPISAANKKNSK